MVKLALALAAAACASVSLAGPIVGPAAGDVEVVVQPEHVDDLYALLPPPTRRETAPKVKRSTLSTSNEDPFAGSQRQYLVHVTNPADGSKLGVVSLPGTGSEGNDDDDLITFDPSGDTARRFAFGPGHQEGAPFEISPSDDGGLFGRRGGLLAAVGRGKPADLAPGSPNFANLGLAHEGPNGLLNLNLPLDLELPSKLLSLTHGNPLGAADVDDMLPGAGGLDLSILEGALDLLPGSMDESALGPIKQLLSRPEAINEMGAPQSAIWTLDPVTKRLNARYVNSDGNAVPTHFVTGGACDHLICITADVEAFRNFWGDDAVELHLAAGIL